MSNHARPFCFHAKKRSRLCANLSLPDMMSIEDALSMIEAVSALTNMQYSPLSVIQLSISGFLVDLKEVFDRSDVQFALFAVHDATVRSLLLAVQDFDGLWPAFASHLILERYQNNSDGSEVVTLSFDGVLLQMSQPCTSFYCKVEEFYDLLAQFVIPFNKCL